MKLIPLTQGKFAKVSDADYELVSPFKWHLKKMGGKFYAARNIPKEGGGQSTLLMHSFLMQTPTGFEVHHKNGDGLDNRRPRNLKLLTRAEHVLDGRLWGPLKVRSASGRRGVTFHKRDNRFQAAITHLGERIHVGYFLDRDAAAHAWDAKARLLGRPESGMNFPAL